MKKKIKIIFMLILLTQLSFAQTGWHIQPSFTSQNIYDCKQSAYNNLYAGSDNGKIFRSTNNGHNWSVYDFNDPLLNTSSFKYILGQNNDNWSTVGSGAAYGYYYQGIDSVLRISASQTKLEALSSLQGYFSYSAIVAAGDGGNFYIKDPSNWRKDTAATYKAAGRNINYCNRYIFVGDNGLIMKADSIGLVHPNGERIKWRVIPSGTTKNLYSVFVNSSATMMAVGEDGIILKSTDFGEHWVTIPSPVTEDLNSIWLGGGYLICGKNGTILRSYDLSYSKWYKQITPTAEDLNIIIPLGNSEYIAMGNNGIMLRTTDGGGSLKRFIGASSIEGFYNSSTNSMISDSISVTIRSSISPFNIIATSKDKLNTGGYGIIQLGPSVQNSIPYYIQINHRNSLETWSKTTQVFSNNDMYYDFYPAANRAYGDNQKQVDTSPVRFAFYSGDINQDGLIDLSDITKVFNDANIFLTGYAVSDVTGDNTVDLSDLTITYNNSSSFVAKLSP